MSCVSICRSDLIVGQHVIIGVLAGRIGIAARRCRNEGTNFSYRRPHRCSIRPRDEAVAKDIAIARGQIARAYSCSVCEGVVSGNDQRYPVQMISLLDESRLDLVAQSEAVLRPFLFALFCRMKPVYCGPLTSENVTAFPSADGANQGADVDE
jgi:hypothetical protein